MTRTPIPRFDDNYSEDAAKARREFLTQQTGASLHHTGTYSLPPESLKSNTENFIGVVQMPVGVAGPVLIHGEHAQGWFYVPLATTEGTLVASYSRGMRMVSESGGVKVTVAEEYMQRAPLFEFEDARPRHPTPGLRNDGHGRKFLCGSRCGGCNLPEINEQCQSHRYPE